MKKALKVLLVVAVLVPTLLLTACGKKEKGLVGKWSTDFAGYTYTYTFNEDGTGTYDAAGTLMKFTYKTDGDKISILYDGNTVSFDTTYSIDGDTLNVKDSLGNDTLYKRK